MGLGPMPLAERNQQPVSSPARVSTQPPFDLPNWDIKSAERMDMAYTLSYLRPVMHTEIVRPAWWQFWRRAELRHTRTLERIVVHDVSGPAADLLLAHGASALMTLVPDASSVQLEEGARPTSYAASNSLKPIMLTVRSGLVDDAWLREMTRP